MKKKSGIIFAICTLLIFLATYTLGFGLKVGDYQVKSFKDMIKLGIDLKGGVYVEEEVVGKTPDKETMQRTKTLLEERVNNLGVSETTVNIQGDNRFRIEIPGVFDSKKALETIGKTGNLTFVGPDNSIVITGKDDVADASVGTDQSGQITVQLKLKTSGIKKFADATQKFLNQKISIKMDEEVISAPTVSAVITDGSAIITGNNSIDEAKRLAGIIKSGALPVKLKPATVKTVGASLGVKAVPTSKKAAAVGIGIVMLFMLVYYKLPGLIADLALTVYMIITLAIFNAIGATLSLPGIAGFLLSVGMAVDANILIFERIKEELANGKSLKSAIDLGFHRALSSIIDANITTLIAGAALYYFGSGSVKGFALTLNLGVIVSMFTAITVTRFMLKTFADAGWVKDTKYFTPIVK